jgi:hypothetical protein
MPETNVVITSEGVATFDRFIAVRANYTDHDDPIEMDEDAESLLGVFSTVEHGTVARALLIARPTAKSSYQATVSGYPPDIMRMRAAGYV